MIKTHTMKKIFLLFSLVILAAFAHAQDKDMLKLAIPHYRILRVDSTYITQDALNKNKPVMFIYFGPDCPHCQHLMSEMEKNMEPFKDIQIVMITFTRTEYPYLNMIRNFSRDYALPKYKNITMGTESPGDEVLKYYHVSTTPFIAIYNNKGKMIKYFDKPPKVEDLITAVKKA